MNVLRNVNVIQLRSDEFPMPTYLHHLFIPFRTRLVLSGLVLCHYSQVLTLLAMSDQLVTPAKPPSPVQINVDAIYPLNDSPILQVHYGGANAQRKPTLVRDRAPPSASVNLCMQTAARLGQAIILHPQGLRTATRTLSDNGKDDTIVAAAIRLALSSTNWLVFIDASLPLDTFGLQHRPDVGHFSAEKALSFYINNWVNYGGHSANR